MDGVGVFGQFSYWLVFYVQVYGMGGVCDSVYCGVQICGGEIRFFGFGDFFQLCLVYCVYFFGVGFIGVVFDVGCFFQQVRCWWCFYCEGKGMVIVNGDYYWYWCILIYLLGLGVERFIEFYDVYVVLVQSGIYWW